MTTAETTTTIDLTGREWLKKIRESDTFGRGSYSTVDECMSDSELAEFLNDDDFKTFEDAWGMLCDLEETHWDMSGIAWKASTETFAT